MLGKWNATTLPERHLTQVMDASTNQKSTWCHYWSQITDGRDANPKLMCYSTYFDFCMSWANKVPPTIWELDSVDGNAD
jgi:hypothetical protein